MTNLMYLPLSKLKLSPTNARQHPGDVTTLANSIAHIGVISPLSVTKNSRGYYVEAGGRRLAALQLLLKRGDIKQVGTSDDQISTLRVAKVVDLVEAAAPLLTAARWVPTFASAAQASEASDG